MNEKLVRDKIIEFSLAANDGRRFRKAELREMPSLLSLKVREEASEVSEEIQFTSIDNTTRLTEEIGDLKDVLEALQDHFHITEQAVLVSRNKKRHAKGKFAARIVLDLDSMPDPHTHKFSVPGQRHEARD